jgi:hypothetical protein
MNQLQNSLPDEFLANGGILERTQGKVYSAGDFF